MESRSGWVCGVVRAREAPEWKRAGGVRIIRPFPSETGSDFSAPGPVEGRAAGRSKHESDWGGGTVVELG